jgi:hypothetical protein
MEQSEPGRHSMFVDAEIVELVLPGLASEPTRSLAQVVETAVPALAPLIRPLGVKLVGRREARAGDRAAESLHWLVGVSRTPTVVRDRSVPCGLTVGGDHIDVDAIRLLDHHALAPDPTEEAASTWTHVTVPWARVRLPEDAGVGVGHDLIVQRRGSNGARLVIPVDRIDGHLWITAPAIVHAVGGGEEREIDPPIAVDARVTTIAGEITGVVSIGVWWSTWWTPGSAGREMVEAVAPGSRPRRRPTCSRSLCYSPTASAATIRSAAKGCSS